MFSQLAGLCFLVKQSYYHSLTSFKISHFHIYRALFLAHTHTLPYFVTLYLFACITFGATLSSITLREEKRHRYKLYWWHYAKSFKFYFTSTICQNLLQVSYKANVLLLDQLPDITGPNTFYYNEHGWTGLNYSMILMESSNFSDT